jgi:cobalt-zinc-cadmium efflux system protein
MNHKKNSSKSVLISLVLNTLLTVIEIIVGTVSGSLSLVADGARNLTDSLMLTVSFIAERLSRRQADEQRTWGYGRIKIIASLINTGIILTVAILIGYEAISRFGQPKHVQGGVVIAVAALSIVVNGGAAMLLKSQRSDLNIRTAYTGLLFGAISSSGVLLSGLLIALFHWYWIDNVTGVAISLLLLYATIQLTKDAIHIILEGVPDTIDIQKVKTKLAAIPLVTNLKEAHAWTLEHDSYVFSCHLVINAVDIAKSRIIVDKAQHILQNEFGFRHITIEIDTVGTL